MIGTISILTIVLCCLIYYWIVNKELWYRMKFFQGDNTLPFIGNAHQLGPTDVDVRNKIFEWWRKYNMDTFKIMIGHLPFVLISTPEAMEIILNSNTLIEKSIQYTYLYSWLGNGLLLTGGQKWRTKRKIITPAFHFKILEQSIDVFHRSCGKLIDNLAAMSDTDRWTEIDVHPLMSKASLDSICESAMGVSVNAQESDCQYANAVATACHCLHQRMFSALLTFDIVFALSKEGRDYHRSIKILHQHTDKIFRGEISCPDMLELMSVYVPDNYVRARSYLLHALKVVRARRSELSREIELVKSGKPLDLDSEDYNGGGKCKGLLAFLDLLLLSKDTDGMMLDDEFITEEVNTFMFAGHDTTASALSFTIYELSKSKYIQDKLLEEQVNVFGVDYNDVPVDKRSLSELRLLDRVIKETLRIHPSVPMIGRDITHDIALPDGRVLTKGISLILAPMLMHMNPNIYSKPETFDPDRFLPENTKNMNPFAYVPFSGGARNCIGQKYAMLELKCFMTLMLRKFEFDHNGFTPQLTADLTLGSANGIKVWFRRRK